MKRVRELSEETKREVSDEDTETTDCGLLRQLNVDVEEGSDSDDDSNGGSVRGDNDNDRGADSDNVSTDYSYEGETGDDDASGDEEEVNDLTVHVPRDSNPGRRVFTRLASFETLEEAVAARDEINGFQYTYDTRYCSKTTTGIVYKCKSHDRCDHRLKLLVVQNVKEQAFEMWEGGRHNTVNSSRRSRHGISRSVRAEIDSFILLGFGAKTIRSMMKARYRHNKKLKPLIPTRKQISNRKAYMKTHLPEGWDISNIATLHVWGNPFLIRNRAQWDEVDHPDDPRMDEMVVLAILRVPGTNGEPDSFVIIATSRRLFKNLVTCVRDQPGSLFCATDGTYKVHFGGWVMVDFGSDVLVWDRNQYVHRFVPWAYMFVKSESTAAYTAMFRVIKAKALEFLDVELDVKFGSIDHSEAIASAFEEVWPRIRILNCWPHLQRQARVKKNLLHDESKYESLIKPHLKMLHSARTHEQFIRMSSIITDEWISCGEREYAMWFRTVYLTRRWERWHVTASGEAGVVPSQQAIEAHHGALKKTCTPHALASTTGVLNSVLPRVIEADGEDLCPEHAGHYCEGPVPPEMLLKAAVVTKGESFGSFLPVAAAAVASLTSCSTAVTRW